MPNKDNATALPLQAQVLGLPKLCLEPVPELSFRPLTKLAFGYLIKQVRCPGGGVKIDV